jgi:hypothetical protein
MRALRELAEHPNTPEHEAALARDRLKAMEAKYGNSNSRSTDNTTTTNRSGQPGFRYRYGSPDWNAWADEYNAQRRKTAEQIAEELLRNQWIWNSEYYDMNGNPRPTEADNTNEDEFYDIFTEEDYDE